MASPLVFEFSFASPEAGPRPEPGQPFRILIMGDFSGRASQRLEDASSLGARRPRKIDIDNVEQAMARLPAALDLHLNGPDGAPTHLAFKEFDDFHPDQLYRKLDLFKALAAARQELHQPVASKPDTTFADLLGGSVRRTPAAAQLASGDLNALIKNLVGAIPTVEPLPHERIGAVDAMIAGKMKALLHDPDFRALEASWRGLHMLITSLELDQELQLSILDVSKSELLDDVRAAGDTLDASSLHAVLSESGRDMPWSAIIGNYSFTSSADDLHLLAAMGALGARAGAPFIAAAANVMEDQEAWQALRTSAHASWIGLALPRLLLRLPYGKQTDSTSHFAFEEAGLPPAHSDYLWGNAALGCALLLGRSFTENSWDLEPGDELEIADLPAHTWRADGEAHLQACAETYLTEREGQALLDHGLMPMLSFKNRNAVRLLRSQSIAHPPAPLSGRWN